MKRSKDDLIAELIKEEPNYKRIDGSIMNINETYDLETSVVTSMVMSSHLIAFGFNETQPAVKMVQELLEDYSSFELNEIAQTVLGLEVVEFYKDLVFADYALNKGAIVKALEKATQETDDSFRDLDKIHKELKEIMPDEE